MKTIFAFILCLATLSVLPVNQTQAYSRRYGYTLPRRAALSGRYLPPRAWVFPRAYLLRHSNYVPPRAMVFPRAYLWRHR